MKALPRQKYQVYKFIEGALKEKLTKHPVYSVTRTNKDYAQDSQHA